MAEKITYAYATKIYPNSYGLQEIILENKFTQKEKLKISRNGSSNGIDTAYYDLTLISDSERKALQEALGIKRDDFVFAFVGRLVTERGVNELVSAFIKIIEQYSNSKLLSVGPYEPTMDPLSASAMEAIHIHSQIISVGWKNEVRSYFAISNSLAFPSYREGFPNVVLQAGAMKLPCIVTNINGCNEIISHNENGIIIPVKDALALCEAMTNILNHQEKSKKNGSIFKVSY